MIIVAITGASGVIYAVRLLEVLNELKIKNSLVISDAAKTIIKEELDICLKDIVKLTDTYYEFNDLSAAINSGSFKFESLVIVPCSMKTLSSIANSYAANTITRVADVALKEKRKIVLVPRETPLRSAHIENMLKVSLEGGIILPPMPGFYNNPKDLNDQIDFIVGKILDSLDIDNDLYNRWK